MNVTGKAAKRILEDKVIMGAFAALKADYTRRIIDSPPLAADQRENCYRMCLAIYEVEAELRRLQNDEAVTSYNQRLRDKNK